MSLIDYIGNLPLSEQLKLLDQGVRDSQTARYIDVAAVTAMLFDILISLDQEISYIWPARWSHGKILYLVTRYPVAIEGILWLVYSVHLNANEPFCKFEAYLAVWGTLVFLIPLQIVIILRTIAIWDRRRIIIILLGVVAFGTDSAILITLSRIMKDFTFISDELLRPLLGCDSSLLHISPTITIPAWSGVIVFDTAIFVLTVIKAISSYKLSRDRLLTILIRDGFVYYAVMLALGVSNLIFLCALPLTRAGLGVCLTAPLRASYCIVGSRLALNLRGAASRAGGTDTKVGADMGGVKLVDLSIMSSGTCIAGSTGSYTTSGWEAPYEIEESEGTQGSNSRAAPRSLTKSAP